MRELCVLREDPEPKDAAAAAATTATSTLLAPLSPRGGSRAADVNISKLIAEKMRSKTFFWSVELLPGTTPHLRAQLEISLEQLARRPPAFVSVTWHVGHLRVPGSGAEHPALELSALLQNAYRIPVLQHLAAGRMTRVQVQHVLEACLAAGVTNIFALRGDDKTDEGSDFRHASDLVHFVRETYGSKFCIGVAGYPSGHPESISLKDDIFHLKEKVDAGAEFILTQMISTFEEFYTFTHNCHELGVKVPIIPGLFLVQSCNTLEKLVRTCNIKVPPKILQELKDLGDIKKEIEYGKHHLMSLLKQLMMFSHCPGAHIFTINRVTEASALFSEIGL